MKKQGQAIAGKTLSPVDHLGPLFSERGAGKGEPSVAPPSPSSRPCRVERGAEPSRVGAVPGLEVKQGRSREPSRAVPKPSRAEPGGPHGAPSGAGALGIATDLATGRPKRANHLSNGIDGSEITFHWSLGLSTTESAL